MNRLSRKYGISLSWWQAPICDPRPIFLLLSLITFRQLRVSWCGASSLTTGRVCSLQQLLLGIASRVFLGSEPPWHRLVRVARCLYGLGGHVSLRVVNETWTDLDLLTFILDLLNQFWNAVMLVCSFCEGITGAMSVVNTAVSPAMVAVEESGEVGRSAVCSRCNLSLFWKYKVGLCLCREELL
jgi:hypothetical protein